MLRTLSANSCKFLLVFLFAFNILNQLSAKKLYYDLKSDKAYIDSLKRMVKKDEDSDKYYYDNPKRLLRYFNSCITLGQYYEKLYKKKIFASTSKSVELYERVTSFGRFPDDGQYFAAAALRNNLCRKLAAMYFAGTGIPKNRQKSLELALKGSSGYNGFLEYYSRKYFNCNCAILKKEIHPEVGTFTFSFNPFVLQARSIDTKMLKPQLITIAETFRKNMETDTAAQSRIVITAYAQASMGSQSRGYRLISSIQAFFLNHYGISSERIETNVERVPKHNPIDLEILILAK